MIIGRGLIASQFTDVDHNDVVIFASGVSNSSETRIEEFFREQNLVEQTLINNPEQLFVYFSTCSIYDSSKYNSPYVLHKLHIEELIKQRAKHYLILRVSNAVGKGGNPNLLMNYLSRQIINKQELNIHQHATRNLIDVEDVKNITLNYIKSKDWNKIVNVASFQKQVSHRKDCFRNGVASIFRKNTFPTEERNCIFADLNFFLKVFLNRNIKKAP